MNQEQLVKTFDLIKRFPIGGSDFTALNRINLTISAGEFCGFVGPSGSGKTTLLNILGALDNPTEGSAEVLGFKVEKLSHEQASTLRRDHIGFIFQTYNLLPVYTVFENVELPLLLNRMSASERKKAVIDALDWVGLSRKVKSRPAQLSGGESQRVAIARAVVKKPQLVLADEPTANLDNDNSFNILDTMKKLNSELNTTFIFATHDEKVIKYLRRIITLNDGVITADEHVDHN